MKNISLKEGEELCSYLLVGQDSKLSICRQGIVAP
jgi:hypothetical protein